MATAVVFDCESDALFARGQDRHLDTRRSVEDERREEIARMECTVACALVLPAHEVHAVATAGGRAAAAARAAHMLEHACERIVCWRDRAPPGGGTRPFEPLLAAFDACAVIVGYNQLGFDMHLLRKYYGRDLARYAAHRAKCLDPFVVLRALTDEWLGLDALLAANGLAQKTGKGTGAVQLWDAVQMGSPEEARAAREALESYCAADVERTARLVLLTSLRVPGRVPLRLPNACCGLASRLAAAQLSDSLPASPPGSPDGAAPNGEPSAPSRASGDQ